MIDAAVMMSESVPYCFCFISMLCSRHFWLSKVQCLS